MSGGDGGSCGSSCCGGCACGVSGGASWGRACACRSGCPYACHGNTSCENENAAVNDDDENGGGCDAALGQGVLCNRGGRSSCGHEDNYGYDAVIFYVIPFIFMKLFFLFF